MAYTLSGTLEEDARVFIINESDWTLEYTGEITAPNFSVATTPGVKLVACRNTEGIISVYGNIIPIYSAELVSDIREVAAGSDDGLTRPSSELLGPVDYWTTYLDYPVGGSDVVGYVLSYYEAWFYLRNLNISQGALITEAVIKMNNHASYTGTQPAEIFIAWDPELTLPTSLSEFNNVLWLPTSIHWDIPISYNGQKTSTDISALLQEVVNQPEWTTSSNVLIWVRPGAASTTDKRFYAFSFEGAGSVENRKPQIAYTTYGSYSFTSVEVPTFSPVSGSTIAQDGNITINWGTPGSRVYYTTDGSTPTMSSTRYTGAFSLGDGGPTLKAKAYFWNVNHWEESSISTATYSVTRYAYPPSDLYDGMAYPYSSSPLGQYGQCAVYQTAPSNSMYLGRYASSYISDVWVMFTGVKIYQGQTVSSSNLRFTREYSFGSGGIYSEIRLAEYDSVVRPITVTDYNSLVMTNSPTTWNFTPTTATFWETPDLSGLIMTITNRSGWQYGNTLLFRIRPTASNTQFIRFYDYSNAGGNSSKYARLTYTTT